MFLIRAATAAALLLLAAASGAAAAQEQQLGAMEEGFSPALMPRWYQGSTDPIFKRQNVVNCDPGTHSCLDVNSTDICCRNDQYCFINPLGAVRCCAIGLQCDSQCAATKYQCNVTSTVTSTGSSSSATVVTQTLAACCDRRCKSTSQYLCPSSLGGGCCAYGAACGTVVGADGSTRGQCRVTAAPETSALVSQVPEGCTTSQISCPASLGGGCCAVGRDCTMVSSQAFCALATVTPTDPAISAVPQGQDGGLSTGAKAGIAVGVVVGAAIVIGVVTFLCVRRRRSPYSSVSQSAVGEVGGGRHGSIPIPIIVHGDESDIGGPGAGLGPISGSTSDVRGPTADYFGPDAVAGPYTDTGVETRDTTPGHDRGVPAEPHGPGDIVAPVELGVPGMEGRSPLGSSASPTASEHPSQLDGYPIALANNQPMPENPDGRFELYGSEVVADPQPSPNNQTSPQTPQGNIGSPTPPSPEDKRYP